jgi:hypothetical protein
MIDPASSEAYYPGTREQLHGLVRLEGNTGHTYQAAIV